MDTAYHSKEREEPMLSPSDRVDESRITEPQVEIPHTHVHFSKGLLLGLGATFFMILVAGMFKYLFLLEPGITIFEIQFAKCIFQMIILLFYTVVVQKRNYFKEIMDRSIVDHHDFKWVMVVAIFGAVANYFAIMSLQYISLVVASLINNTFPIFVLIVAAIMLREVLKKIQVGFIILSFLGVIFMSFTAMKTVRQSEAFGHMYGLILLSSAELIGAVSYVSLRKIPFMYFMYAPFFKILITFLISLGILSLDLIVGYQLILDWNFTIRQVLFFLAIAIMDLSCQLMMCRSFQVEKAGLIASMNFACVLWAFIGDMLIFDVSYSYFEIFGGFIVFSSTVGILFAT